MTLVKRERNGISLLRADSVRPVSQSVYNVRAQKGPEQYEVTWSRKLWICNCGDFNRYGKRCKHIYAVQYYLMMRNITTDKGQLDQEVDQKCPMCNSSCVIKRGLRYSRTGSTQRYYCKMCGRRFTLLIIGRARNRATVVMAALDLYFRGVSLRQICEHLEAYWNCRVSYTTVLRWIRKYVEVVSQAIEKDTRIRSERWNADETLVRLNGRHILFWTLLDERHRFLIALKISSRRTETDAASLATRAA